MRQAVKTLRATAVQPGCRYLLYTPDMAPDAAQAPPRPWPLLLFLHGAGERGTDIQRVAIHGPPMLAETGQDLPFAILSPQCPANEIWSMPVLLALLDHAQRTLPIDPERVYVTGLSMGGYGTWELARTAPHRFAAVVPICGGAPPLWSWALGGLPIWAFHGSEDTVVPPSQSREIVDWFVKYKIKPTPKLTIYKNVAHNSWTRTYGNPRVFEWMLQHRRRVAPAPQA